MALDTPAYREFKERRQLWVECLAGKDQNSILQQVYQMVWDAAVFRTVNQARRIAPQSKQGRVRLNGMVHGLLNHCFFTSQMTAIRRLTDTSPLVGNRPVYSLKPLLQDMQEHVQLITRENVLEALGLQYDYSHIVAAYERYASEQTAAGIRGFHVPPELDYSTHEIWHEHMDRLAGVDPQHRAPSDQVRPVVFDHLLQKLNIATSDVVQHVNKFIAHAATPGDRSKVGTKAAGVTLSHLWTAHRSICEIINLLDACLLTGSSHGFLPSPLYDQFEYLERPLVRRTEVESLRDAWDDYRHEVDRWAGYGVEELEAEMTAG